MGVCSPFVDTNIGKITVVTSTTRPTGANLYAGKWIYESDTLRTLMYDGTGWIIMDEPTQTFTPNWSSGLTTTSGTNEGRYRRSGGWYDFFAKFTFGASSAVTGSVVLTYPIACIAGNIKPQLVVQYYDQSANVVYDGAPITPGSASSVLGVLNAAGTYATVVVLAATIPFGVAWTTSDTIAVWGRGEMTTRYS